MKKLYKVKPENWDTWGVDTEANAIVDDDEIRRLSIEWELSEDVLRLDVVEILPEE